MALKKYAYSVISYVPDYTRGEQFNIGVLMFGEKKRIIGFQIITTKYI